MKWPPLSRPSRRANSRATSKKWTSRSSPRRRICRGSRSANEGRLHAERFLFLRSVVLRIVVVRVVLQRLIHVVADQAEEIHLPLAQRLDRLPADADA